jgi:hypothetical protein
MCVACLRRDEDIPITPPLSPNPFDEDVAAKMIRITPVILGVFVPIFHSESTR